MKKNFGRRLFVFALSALMVLSFLPTTSMALDESDTNANLVEESTGDGDSLKQDTNAGNSEQQEADNPVQKGGEQDDAADSAKIDAVYGMFSDILDTYFKDRSDSNTIADIVSGMSKTQKSALQEALDAAMTAYDELSDEDIAQFDEDYADMLKDMQAIDEALNAKAKKVTLADTTEEDELYSLFTVNLYVPDGYESAEVTYTITLLDDAYSSGDYTIEDDRGDQKTFKNGSYSFTLSGDINDNVEYILLPSGCRYTVTEQTPSELSSLKESVTRMSQSATYDISGNPTYDTLSEVLTKNASGSLPTLKLPKASSLGSPYDVGDDLIFSYDEQDTKAEITLGKLLRSYDNESPLEQTLSSLGSASELLNTLSDETFTFLLTLTDLEDDAYTKDITLKYADGSSVTVKANASGQYEIPVTTKNAVSIEIDDAVNFTLTEQSKEGYAPGGGYEYNGYTGEYEDCTYSYTIYSLTSDSETQLTDGTGVSGTVYPATWSGAEITAYNRVTSGYGTVSVGKNLVNVSTLEEMLPADTFTYTMKLDNLPDTWPDGIVTEEGGKTYIKATLYDYSTSTSFTTSTELLEVKDGMITFELGIYDYIDIPLPDGTYYEIAEEENKASSYALWCWEHYTTNSSSINGGVTTSSVSEVDKEIIELPIPIYQSELVQPEDVNGYVTADTTEIWNALNTEKSSLGTITLEKEVSGTSSDDYYYFRITVPGATSVYNPDLEYEEDRYTRLLNDSLTAFDTAVESQVNYTDPSTSNTFGFDDNGVLRIKLKAGQSFDISGLPLGENYTIDEVFFTDSGEPTYKVLTGTGEKTICEIGSGVYASSPETGTVAKDTEVTFSNVTGNALKVSKTVSGKDAGEYAFDITLEYAGKYAYTITDSKTGEAVKSGTMKFGSSKTRTVTLKDNQTLWLTGLEEGMGYTVTEQALSDYTVSINGKDSDDRTITGTIDTSYVSTAEYVNTYIDQDDSTAGDDSSTDKSSAGSGKDSSGSQKVIKTKTGDDTNLALYSGAMLLALAGALAAVRKRKKDSNR